SDILGAPTTNYPGTTQSGFAVEFDAGGDIVTISNPRTLTFHSQRQGTGLDELRIITKHDGAPVVSAGGPYTGAEGAGPAGGVTLHGSATDAENDFLTYSWAFTTTNAKPGTVC